MTRYRKLLVTGHLGFIGSAFCWLCRDRYEIAGLDFCGWGSMEENLAPGVADTRFDIGDERQLPALLDRFKPDAIVNFAAESHVDRSIDHDAAFWQSNVLGVRNLALAACERGIRVVQVSTDEVYGDAIAADRPWTEETSIAPRNPYSVTKASAELLLLAYRHTHGLDVVITRGANTVGPRQFPEKAVPKAVDYFQRGKPFPLFRTPARRMWMHAEDHAAGVEAALLRGEIGEVYNLAPPVESEAYTQDVIKLVRDIVGRGDIEEVDDRKGYDLRYFMSADKARAALEWAPRHTLQATIANTVEWYLANPDWCRAAAQRLEAGWDV
jgi:dTDP-glucose 4,6-dehydratase